MLAEISGLEVNQGIIVNDFMETSVPGIYAVGECAEHRGQTYGLVAPLYDQANVLAGHLCGMNPAPYEGSVMSTQLKVSGVDVFSAGDFIENDEKKAI
ncbi:FAD-dependent oxidoreductase, partial [Bacillus sp. SIMBA_008]